MSTRKNKKNDNYYVRQAAMCKNLGIKPPPEDMGLIRKLRYIYKQLKQEYLK